MISSITLHIHVLVTTIIISVITDIFYYVQVVIMLEFGTDVVETPINKIFNQQSSVNLTNRLLFPAAPVSVVVVDQPPSHQVSGKTHHTIKLRSLYYSHERSAFQRSAFDCWQ